MLFSLGHPAGDLWDRLRVKVLTGIWVRGNGHRGLDVDKPCRLGWERMEGGLTEKMKYKHRYRAYKGIQIQMGKDATAINSGI